MIKLESNRSVVLEWFLFLLCLVLCLTCSQKTKKVMHFSSQSIIYFLFCLLALIEALGMDFYVVYVMDLERKSYGNLA